ncbi:MAG: hypothetical protein U0172_00935 [Nitrospiraceae bacterium]
MTRYAAPTRVHWDCSRIRIAFQRTQPLLGTLSVGLALSLVLALTAQAADLGTLSANPYAPNSSANPFGAGNPFAPDSITNPFSRYGNPFSNQSATNPFATDAPRLYDQQGNYRGKLSANPYDPESTSNPYGRYGSPFSPESLNNPYGAGNPYRPDSPTNPYGSGWRIEGR